MRGRALASRKAARLSRASALRAYRVRATVSVYRVPSDWVAREQRKPRTCRGFRSMTEELSSFLDAPTLSLRHNSGKARVAEAPRPAEGLFLPAGRGLPRRKRSAS